MKQFGKKFWFLLKSASLEFAKDNAIGLSASLSFYMLFSLPLLTIAILSLFNLLFGPDAIKSELFGQINILVGNTTALRIQEMIKNINVSNGSAFATASGIIVVLIGAAGVFSGIQSSINYIWGIKSKPKNRLIAILKNSLMSFAMIGAAGFLLITGLITDTLMHLLNHNSMNDSSETIRYLFHFLNFIIVFLLITLLFTIIFKALPDGKIRSKDSLIGALFTCTLFFMGKFVIGAYIGGAHIISMYGAVGSVTILLIWVYYSSIILYFGAEFTKVYAKVHGGKIIPS
jgi:membrane protein